jgi:Zn-dependent M16 (insulinase) family peptidase
MSKYKLLDEIEIDNQIPVKKYLFETGIKVYVANTFGPICNSFIALATEEDSDLGRPHTLEHLVFLGSEDHPYKGILDLLANRCQANGTSK